MQYIDIYQAIAECGKFDIVLSKSFSWNGYISSTVHEDPGYRLPTLGREQIPKMAGRNGAIHRLGKRA
jgi:hypothetical protein